MALDYLAPSKPAHDGIPIQTQQSYTRMDFIKRINDLYIMTRSKFIMQRSDGKGYNTLYHPKLNDGIIRQHLNQTATVGIFAGKYLNKFICFDVDCGNQAKQMTLRLVECLQVMYGFTSQQILVSYSGDKGYHVELFFDKAISVTHLYTFYQLVLTDLAAKSTEIEFRNSFTQAVKLPLSIHQRTKNKCYLVDIHSFTEVEDSYLFAIQKIDAAFFLEQLTEIWIDTPSKPLKQSTMTLESNIAEQFEEVISNMRTHLDIDYKTRAYHMMESEKLLYPNSRHNSTLLLGALLREYEYPLQESIQIVYRILENTWYTARHLYNADTTLAFIRAETERLLTLVYEKGYSFGKHPPKPIRFTKADVIHVLKPKKLHLRKLLFSMVCHAKRFGKADGSFYMTYRQMSEMGNTDNRTRLIAYVTELSEQSCIEIVRRNERKEKSHLHKPNVYRISAEQMTSKISATYIELSEITVQDFDRVVTQLLSAQELKQFVTPKQFRTTFKEYYTA